MALGEWLEGDDPFAQTKAEKTEVRDEALIFAQKFLIFTTGPGLDLLNHWSSVVRNRIVPTTASWGELAQYEGMRQFVERIHQQVSYAQSGGQTPYKER
jgi:hypothetical protein